MKVIIEVSKNSNIKYEYDKVNKCLILDRILHNTNFFPYNYRFKNNLLGCSRHSLTVLRKETASLPSTIL